MMSLATDFSQSYLDDQNDVLTAVLQEQDNSSIPPISMLQVERGASIPYLDFGALDEKSTSPIELPDDHQQHPNNNILTRPMPTSNLYGTYSQSGIDILKILFYLANRPNPQIILGPVDFSAAVIITDLHKFDNPIVYVSPAFEQLTGYSSFEVIGSNPRFLQAPDGVVTPGSKRRYTDNFAVQQMKEKIMTGKEYQGSLVNYRKNGKPFVNFLSYIPIAIELEELYYYVGFCVDIAAQSNAVLESLRNGAYINEPTGSSTMSSSLFQIPRQLTQPCMSDFFQDPVSSSSCPMQPPPQQMPTTNYDLASGTLPFITTSQVLSLLANVNDNPKIATRQWYTFLLDNADDFVYVLSFKGVFVYCSPSVKEVLGYDREELIGQNLSMICHPRDIIAVMRDLKESVNEHTIYLVFRVLKKDRTHMWLQSHGKMHLEESKGPKRFLLSSHEITTCHIPNDKLMAAGGVNLNSFWTKISIDGIFLFVTRISSELIGYNSSELVGRSIYEMIKPNHSMQVTKAIAKARHGDTSQLQHDLLNSTSTFTQVTTIFYGGDNHPLTETEPSFLILQVTKSKDMMSSNSKLPSQFLTDLDPSVDTFWQYNMHQLQSENDWIRTQLETKSVGSLSQCYGQSSSGVP